MDALIKSERQTLVRLNLEENNITEKGVLAIGEWLEADKTCEELRLAWNKISCTGGLKLFRRLSSNQHLQYLDLAWNSLASCDGCHTNGGFGNAAVPLPFRPPRPCSCPLCVHI